MANATAVGGISGGIQGGAAGAKTGNPYAAAGGLAGGTLAGLWAGSYMDAGNQQRQDAIDSASAADQANQARLQQQYGNLDQFGQQRYGQQMGMQNQALQAYQQGQMSGPQAQAYLAQQQAQYQQGMQAPTQVAAGSNGAMARRYQAQAQQRGAAAVAPAQLQAAQAHMQANQADVGRQYQQAGWQNQAYNQNTNTQTGLERAGINAWGQQAANNSQTNWHNANQAGAGNFAKGGMVQGVTNTLLGAMGSFGGGGGGLF